MENREEEEAARRGEAQEELLERARMDRRKEMVMLMKAVETETSRPKRRKIQGKEDVEVLDLEDLEGNEERVVGVGKKRKGRGG